MNLFNGIDLQSSGHVKVCESLMKEEIPFFYEAPISLPNDDARNRRMDLVIPGPYLLLVIEIDGPQHNEIKHRSDDYLRDRLTSRFARTIRFTHAEANERTQNVIDTIRLELEIDLNASFVKNDNKDSERNTQKVLILKKELIDKDRTIGELQDQISKFNDYEKNVLSTKIVRKYKNEASDYQTKYIQLRKETKDAMELKPVLERTRERLTRQERENSLKDLTIDQLKEQLSAANARNLNSNEELHMQVKNKVKSCADRIIGFINYK